MINRKIPGDRFPFLRLEQKSFFLLFCSFEPTSRENTRPSRGKELPSKTSFSRVFLPPFCLLGLTCLLPHQTKITYIWGRFGAAVFCSGALLDSAQSALTEGEHHIAGMAFVEEVKKILPPNRENGRGVKFEWGAFLT